MHDVGLTESATFGSNCVARASTPFSFFQKTKKENARTNRIQPKRGGEKAAPPPKEQGERQHYPREEATKTPPKEEGREQRQTIGGGEKAAPPEIFS